MAALSACCKLIHLILVLLSIPDNYYSILASSTNPDNGNNNADAPANNANTIIQCRDDDGNNVDWFIAYKLPMDSASTDTQFKQGSAYFYMTPAVTSWKRSAKPINELDSIVGLTLQPLLEVSRSSNGSPSTAANLAYVLYNDQAPPPAPAVFWGGHTKGTVFTNSTHGVWLVHSVPHFPKLANQSGSSSSFSDYYPFGGLENGQIFLCLSLNIQQIDGVIGNALLYTKPNVYEYSIPQPFISLLPKLNDIVAHNATQKQAPWFVLNNVQTNDGVNFMVFVKGVKFRKDIYSAWISQKLSTGLNVQSWLQGSHPSHSDCTSKYSVYNILGKDIMGENFNCTNDHSKWANGIEQPWTCISDLNRTKPQKTRGGLALCVSNKNIWTAFKSAVVNTQPCDKP